MIKCREKSGKGVGNGAQQSMSLKSEISKGGGKATGEK